MMRFAVSVPTLPRPLTNLIGLLAWTPNPHAAGAFTISAPQATPGVDQSIVVDSVLDEPDADPSDLHCASQPSGVCTLRAAITQANNVAIALAAIFIIIPAGVYTRTLFIPASLDITYSMGLGLVHLVGAGANQTILDGYSLHIAASAEVDISDVTVCCSIPKGMLASSTTAC